MHAAFLNFHNVLHTPQVGGRQDGRQNGPQRIASQSQTGLNTFFSQSIDLRDHVFLTRNYIFQVHPKLSISSCFVARIAS